MASLLAVPCRASALFISAGSTQRRGATQRRGLRIACASSPKSGSGKGESASAKTSSAADAEAPNPGAGLKAVWMGAEAFGNVVGALKSSKKQGQLRQQEASKLDGPSLAEQQAGAALKREQALALIREDFIQNYFVTGQGALAAYDPDCLFADPFASFNGTARFKRNVSNLGGLLTDIDLTLTDWQEGEDELRTKWRFSATLSGLPWKPLLAAAGGTTFVFDPATGRVCKHIESWDIEPARVLRQLLKPSAKVPATQAEVLMSGVYDGDITGIWYAVSSKVVAVAGPASALLAMLHLARGEGAGWLEGGMYLAFLAAVVTELGKIIGNVTGGGG